MVEHRLDIIDHRLDVLEQKIDRIFEIVEKIAKRGEANEQERLTLSSRVNRHDIWISKASKKLGIGYGLGG